MCLDWFPGQKCTLKAPLGAVVLFILEPINRPEFGAVYTIGSAEPCDDCGAHLLLRELGARVAFPARWFRPVDPVALDELRALLTPDGDGDPAPAKREFEEVS
jgi:hypothetical protein